MSLNLYLAYVAACIGLALLPGPNVTLVIASGLRYGVRAAFITIPAIWPVDTPEARITVSSL